MWRRTMMMMIGIEGNFLLCLSKVEWNTGSGREFV